MPSVAMIDGRRKTRISVALKSPVASPTATSARRRGSAPTPTIAGVIVYEAVTTHSVISAATETSKPPTSSALVWPIETRASGIVARRRLRRL